MGTHLFSRILVRYQACHVTYQLKTIVLIGHVISPIPCPKDSRLLMYYLFLDYVWVGKVQNWSKFKIESYPDVCTYSIGIKGGVISEDNNFNLVLILRKNDPNWYHNCSIEGQWFGSFLWGLFWDHSTFKNVEYIHENKDYSRVHKST